MFKAEGRPPRVQGSLPDNYFANVRVVQQQFHASSISSVEMFNSVTSFTYIVFHIEQFLRVTSPRPG